MAPSQEHGRSVEARTPGLSLPKRVLYQLSYTSIIASFLRRWRWGFTGKYSRRLATAIPYFSDFTPTGSAFRLEFIDTSASQDALHIIYFLKTHKRFNNQTEVKSLVFSPHNSYLYPKHFIISITNYLINCS